MIISAGQFASAVTQWWSGGDQAGSSDGKGLAYVFKRPGEGWADMTETAKLTGSDSGASDYFGTSVSISGNTVVVGAHCNDDNGNNSGSAYVFEKPGGCWATMTETSKLMASDGEASDLFGKSVSISGNTVVVGAYRDDNYKGSAYVFKSPDEPVDDFSATQRTTSNISKNNPQLQVVNNRIYYVWSEQDGSHDQIWTAQMNTDGTGWSATQRTTGATSKSNPQLQVVNNRIYYVWSELDGFPYQIWTAQMNTDGTGWSATQRTTSNISKNNPQLQVVNNRIYYVWSEQDGSYDQIWTAQMNTDGTGWSATQRTTSATSKDNPQLQVVNNRRYYVWSESDGSYTQICTTMISADGTIWTETTTSATNKYNPQLQVVNNRIYYVWSESDGSHYQIWTAQMNTDGTGWSSTQRTTSAADKSTPQLQVCCNKIYYVWSGDSEGGNITIPDQIWTAQMNTDGTGWSSTIRAGGMAVNKYNPQLQVVNNTIYYVWSEWGYGFYTQIWTAVESLNTGNTPILLVHGYGGSPEATWGDMGAILGKIGFDVYYADYSAAPLNWTIQNLASLVSMQIAQVLSRTGASQIDIVSHSMGGLVVRAYMTGLVGPLGRDYGGEIREFIMIAAPNHGSKWALLWEYADHYGLSTTQARQMEFGSNFIWELNTRWNELGLSNENMLTIAGERWGPIDRIDDDWVVNISSVGLYGVEQRYVPYVHIDWFPGIPISRVEDMNDEHMTYRIVKEFLCNRNILSQSQIGYDPPNFGQGMLLVRFFDEHDQPIQIPSSVSDMFFDWEPNEWTETVMNWRAGSQTDMNIDQGGYTVYTSGLEVGYQDTIAINVDISTAKTTIKKVQFTHPFINPSSGVPHTGTTIGAPSNFDSYNCSSWYESGPEVIHSITTVFQGDITASLSNLSADLDVFILSESDPNSCIVYGDYDATYPNAPAGTYYIVVDGYNGVSSEYTLTATYKGRKVLPGVLMLLLGD